MFRKAPGPPPVLQEIYTIIQRFRGYSSSNSFLAINRLRALDDDNHLLKKSEAAILCLTIAILGGDVMTARELGYRALDCVDICERCMHEILTEMPEHVAVQMVQMATEVIERMPSAPAQGLTTTAYHGYGSGHAGGNFRPDGSSRFDYTRSDFGSSRGSDPGPVHRSPFISAPNTQPSTGDSVIDTADHESVSAVDDETYDDNQPEAIDMTSHGLESNSDRDNEDGWDVDQEPTEYAR